MLIDLIIPSIVLREDTITKLIEEAPHFNQLLSYSTIIFNSGDGKYERMESFKYVITSAL
jgi:hypothetical protein